MVTTNAAVDFALKCVRCGLSTRRGDIAGCPRAPRSRPPTCPPSTRPAAAGPGAEEPVGGAAAGHVALRGVPAGRRRFRGDAWARGGTPLIECPSLGSAIGLPRLLLKNESANPTWSFKDRLASVGFPGRRRWDGGIVLSSSGNAGASAAAYAARAGLPCLILTTRSFPRACAA